MDPLALRKVRHAGRLQRLPQQRRQLAVPQPRGLYACLQRGAVCGCAPARFVHPWRAWQRTRSGTSCNAGPGCMQALKMHKWLRGDR